ncbi:MFS transporter [Xenorhabdus littoralis]|uniref:MFS transporter n=1 Tax=Xenorhabdus littoralis TaxID=2582835 RepID=UPI0029E8283B|nr:MFS transporter [Xenorhabdus sp. psl]
MGRLLTGYGLSVIADTSVYIVFAVWAKQLTGSTAGAGFVFFCFIIPSLISPLTGNIIDSLRKDSTIVFTNLFMAASILALHFSHEKYQYILLLISALIYGLGYVIFNSARVCLVVNNYDEHHIGQINAVLRTLRESVRLTAPLFGVYIYTAFGNHVFVWFVSLSLIFSAFLFLNFEKKSKGYSTSNVSAFSLQGLWDGARGLWYDPLIRSCVICLSVTLLVAGFYEIILFSIIDHLHQPLSVIGQLISAQGIGAVMGGIVSIRLIKRLSPGVLVSVGFFIQVAGILGLFAQDIAIIYISCAVFGFGAPISMVGLDTLIQTKLPFAVQGRANTSLEAITSIPFSLSFLVSSLMTAVISYKVMLFYMAVVTVSAACFLLLVLRKAAYAPCHSGDDDP